MYWATDQIGAEFPKISTTKKAMMTEEEKYELFERYNTNELTSEERKGFEKLLEDDDGLKEELTLYQSMSSTLANSFDPKTAAVEENLKEIGNQFFAREHITSADEDSLEKEKETKKGTKKETKRVRLQPWMYVAAASVAIVFGVYFFGGSGVPQYSDYAISETIRFVERSGNSVLFTKAEESFNTKEYEAAIVIFDKILEENGGNAQVHYYKSIALVETNQFLEAEKLLKQLSEGKSVYKYKARWIHALSLLKQKKQAQCANVLKTIPEEAEDYGHAQELLKKL